MTRITSVLIFSLIVFTSCDKCKDVNCGVGGICEDGSCVCDAGFSGVNCEIEDLCITNNVECQNDGVCVNGECDCTDWHTGEDCSELILEQWTGLYGGYFVCNSNYSTDYFNFSPLVAASNEMTVEHNTANYPSSFVATFNTEDDFDVKTQPLEDNNPDNITISGDGSFSAISGLSMVLTYTNSTQGTSTTCTFESNL